MSDIVREEQRSEERFSFSASAGLLKRSSGEWGQALGCDISDSGMAIATIVALLVGDSVMVVWLRPQGDAASFSGIVRNVTWKNGALRVGLERDGGELSH